MRSSFRRSHRRTPSVTQFPFSVVICLSIYHCHINFWKQRRYGNRKQIRILFVCVIPMYVHIVSTFLTSLVFAPKMFLMLNKVIWKQCVGIIVEHQTSSLVPRHHLMLIYKSLDYWSRHRRLFLLEAFKQSERGFCFKGALFLVIRLDGSFSSEIVSILVYRKVKWKHL